MNQQIPTIGIKACLIPFIKRYHKSNKVLFWPDLAMSHYASSITKFLENQNINIVPKEKNLQNCPQARPAEVLWSILNEKIYASGWETKTIGQLKRRINQKLKGIYMKSVQAMFPSIKK